MKTEEKYAQVRRSSDIGMEREENVFLALACRRNRQKAVPVGSPFSSNTRTQRVDAAGNWMFNPNSCHVEIPSNHDLPGHVQGKKYFRPTPFVGAVNSPGVIRCSVRSSGTRAPPYIFRTMSLLYFFTFYCGGKAGLDLDPCGGL